VHLSAFSFGSLPCSLRRRCFRKDFLVRPVAARRRLGEASGLVPTRTRKVRRSRRYTLRGCGASGSIGRLTCCGASAPPSSASRRRRPQIRLPRRPSWFFLLLPYLLHSFPRRSTMHATTVLCALLGASPALAHMSIWCVHLSLSSSSAFSAAVDRRRARADFVVTHVAHSRAGPRPCAHHSLSLSLSLSRASVIEKDHLTDPVLPLTNRYGVGNGFSVRLPLPLEDASTTSGRSASRRRRPFANLLPRIAYSTTRVTLSSPSVRASPRRTSGGSGARPSVRSPRRRGATARSSSFPPAGPSRSRSPVTSTGRRSAARRPSRAHASTRASPHISRRPFGDELTLFFVRSCPTDVGAYHVRPFSSPTVLVEARSDNPRA